MDNTSKTQAIDRLKSAQNILISVSTNPSVDQLSAAIGLALLLTKAGKHATAVFSGEMPSTIEFLKPEETFEKNTDSLRDFIISLDKAKAEKANKNKKGKSRYSSLRIKQVYRAQILCLVMEILMLM